MTNNNDAAIGLRIRQSFHRILVARQCSIPVAFLVGLLFVSSSHAAESDVTDSIDAQFTCQPQYTGDSGVSLPWLKAGQDNRPVMSALFALLNAGSHGLDPRTYGARELADKAQRLIASDVAHTTYPYVSDATQRVRSSFNRQLTRAITCYLQQVRTGQLEPELVHARTQLRPHFWKSAIELDKAWKSGSVDQLIFNAAPQSRDYKQLRNALAEYRALLNGQEPLVDTWQAQQTTLIRRKSYPTAGAWQSLRNRLEFLGDLKPSRIASVKVGSQGRKAKARMLKKTRAALRRFQSRHGLKADGKITQQTLDAVNVPITHRIVQLELSMERIRWLPRDEGQRRVTVNVPEFRVRVTSNNRVLYTSKTIVGAPGRSATPFFSGRLSRVVFNPAWNVPHSIAKYQLVPRLRRNPEYLREKNMVIIDREGLEFDTVHPELLRLVERNKARIVQLPGKKNALGKVKFLLPNYRAIFMHDTNKPELFDKTSRAMSNGCVRIEDPERLAAMLLRGTRKWSTGRVNRTMASGRTRSVTPQRSTLVVLTYQTAVARANGSVSFAPDIYGFDKEATDSLTRWSQALKVNPTPAGYQI